MNWSQPSWSVRRNRLVTRIHCKTPTSVEDLSPTHPRVEWLEDCRTDRKLPATFPQHPPAVDIYRTRLILQGPGELAFTVLMHACIGCMMPATAMLATAVAMARLPVNLWVLGLTWASPAGGSSAPYPRHRLGLGHLPDKRLLSCLMLAQHHDQYNIFRPPTTKINMWHNK